MNSGFNDPNEDELGVICNTTHEVIEHEFIYHTLINAYNLISGDDDQINMVDKKYSLTDEDKARIGKFIVHISNYREDYRLFENLLKQKYIDYMKKDPGIFDQRHIMSALTALDYTKFALFSVAMTYEKTNMRLNEILRFDDHLGKESVQIRRLKLLNAGVPLLDCNGNEVVDYDKKFDPEYVCNPVIEYLDYKLFSVFRKGFNGGKVLIDISGQVIGKNNFYNKDGVYPDAVEVVFAGMNGLYFKRFFEKGISDRNGELLYDEYGNLILDIFEIIMIGNQEYFQVLSDKYKKPYYINSATKEIFCVNWDENRIITKVRGMDNDLGLYNVLDMISNICIIDEYAQSQEGAIMFVEGEDVGTGEEGGVKLVVENLERG